MSITFTLTPYFTAYLEYYFYNSKTRGDRKNGVQIWNQRRKIPTLLKKTFFGRS